MTLAVAADGAVLAGMVGGVYRTTDDSTWTQLPARGVRFATRILSRGSTIIVQSETDLHISSDNGITWDRHTTYLGRRYVRLILADSAGGLIGDVESGGSGFERLVRSGDDGRSWQVIDGSPSNIYPRNGVTTGAGVIVLASGGRVFRSSDDGLSWDSNDVATGESLGVLALVDDSTIVASSGAGLHRSSDHGVTWVSVSAPPAGAFAGSADRLFALVRSEHSLAGIYRSSDRGQTWTRAGNAIVGGYRSSAIALSPRGNLVAADETRMIRSRDDGATWHDVTRGIRSFSIPSFAVGPDNSLHGTKGWWGPLVSLLSRDEGRTWTSFPDSMERAPMQLIVTRGGDLVQSRSDFWGEGVLVRSSDNGRTWAVVADSTPGEVTSFARGRNGSIVAGLVLQGGFGAYDGGVMRTTDDGRTWNDLGFERPVSSVWVMADGAILAGAFWSRDYGPPFSGGSLWRSIDDGSTWQQLDDTLYLGCIVGDAGGMLFAGGGRDTYRSGDGGLSWSVTPLPYDGWAGISSMALDSNGVLYAGTFRDGVFRSTDHGLSWAAFNDGVLSRVVDDIVVSPSNVVYLVTNDNGLYRLDGDARPSPAHDAATLRIIPNPARRVVTIAVDVPSARMLDVRLYDALGQDLATLVSAERGAGTFLYSYDTAALADGSYFIVARVGDEIISERIVTVH